ncbi:GntR family transcriptional regulator [Brevundimonas naejangsanensis]|uniref:GntR family transcriptional regulator n=1 Tax=Brevundimonas naejangsanensis TaxID=588932 RepID=UPI00106C390C|nr:GntR family transcriptional regulator [Brevundimonas naejangsanensis]QBQ47249.1 GntR family transcriptional regulator [Brevundimonas naejangsanensis]
MAVSPLEIRTLSDRLMEVVRDMILSGAIAPDVPIRQDALAAGLNVSKIPLREALVRLEQDGLVVSQANRGFFVRGMSATEAEEIFKLRLKLEPEAAAQACLAADEQQRGAARRVLAELDAAAAAHLPSVGRLNRAFHMALTQPGGLVLTAEITARLHVMADRYVRKHLEHGDRHVTAEAEHHHILRAWLARDAETVSRLVEAHLEHTLRDLRDEFASAAGTAEQLERQPICSASLC